MDRPVVSFITVTYRAPDHLESLLQTIEAAGLGFPYEYFVVNNHSGDDTSDRVSGRFPWASLIELSTNVGFGAANNSVFPRVKGRYIILLNHHMRITPGELEKWLTWMDEHPLVGISGPRMKDGYDVDQPSCFHFPTWMMPLYRRTFLGRTDGGRRALDWFAMRDMDRETAQDVDWILGAAMCIRPDTLRSVGPFDEKFFMYFEDVDFCYRAWQKGLRVTYTPAARLTHVAGRSSRTQHPWEIFTNVLARTHVKSGIRFFLKHFGEPNPRTGGGVKG